MSDEFEDEGPAPVKMGFGASPDELTMVFVGGDEGDESGSCWYTRDFDKDRNYPIESRAITGLVQNVKVSKSLYKGKPNYKLNIVLKADKRYQIRAGIDTFFSRGFLLAFEQFIAMGNNHKEVPVTITVRPGQDSKVIFCSLFRASDNSKIFVEWDGQKNLLPVVTSLQKEMGVTVQTRDMIDNPDNYKGASRPERDSQPSLRNTEPAYSGGEVNDEEANRQADEIFGKEAAEPDLPKTKRKAR